LNILFVSDVSISKATSGAERVLFEQSTLLQKRGHNVHVLTRKLPEHESNKEVIQGVTEWRYNIDYSSNSFFVKSILFDCKKLFEFLHNQNSFDVINFHQPFSAFGVVRSSASKRIKKIYTCHSLSFEEFRSRNPRPENVTRRILYSLNIQIRKHIERKVLKSSDRITVLSQFTQEKLRSTYKIPREKIAIIPGGVNLQRFTPAVDKREIRERLGLPQEKVMLLTVRDMEPRMGLENLIHAVKIIYLAIPDVYLVLGGQGPLKANLISLAQKLEIENYIRFTGFIPEKQLPDYYKMADIFILPTVELEGFGLITLEALASGVPVLGTPVGGTVEILNKLDSKYLFKDTKPESMASLIVEMCQEFKDNPGHLQDVSSQCRLFVEENYSWEKNVNLLEKVMLDVVEEGSTFGKD